MTRKQMPPELAADLEEDAREGAALRRRFREMDRAYERSPGAYRKDYSEEWHAANRACWRHSLGKMVDKYGLYEHWTTYYAAEQRHLTDLEEV